MQRKLLLPLCRITQPSLWQGMSFKSLRAHSEFQSLGKTGQGCSPQRQRQRQACAQGGSGSSSDSLPRLIRTLNESPSPHPGSHSTARRGGHEERRFGRVNALRACTQSVFCLFCQQETDFSRNTAIGIHLPTLHHGGCHRPEVPSARRRLTIWLYR